MIGELDPLIHAPKRLVTMAMLSTATSITFASLRDRLEISDSDLSKQMTALERAGYVAVSKVGRGRGASTTYRLTAAGRTAYTAHRQALRDLLDLRESLEQD